MLLWHRLSFVRLGFGFLLLRTKDKLIAPIPTLFSYPPSAFTLKDREPNKSPLLPSFTLDTAKLQRQLCLVESLDSEKIRKNTGFLNSTQGQTRKTKYFFELKTY